MSRFRKILWMLPLILILTASSAVSVFAESGTVFTFTLQENEISNDSDKSDSDIAPATGDTSCLTYLISAACAGSAAVLCCVKFRSRSLKRDKP